jgi:undecaprenyl-diphosphatase
MIEWLEGIDRAIVLAVNGLHTPFLDHFFWYVSAKGTWLPFYLLLIWMISLKYGAKRTLIIVAVIAAAVGIADLSAVHLFKNIFMRYRPSHHALLTNRLHFYALDKNNFYKGGMYGFISNHAVNFFALSVITGLSLRKAYPKLLWIMLGVSVLICFSRLYLGVHYLSDLIAGAAWGSLIAYLAFRFLMKPYVLKEISGTE